jgi:di/tricarboxylate transporter
MGTLVRTSSILILIFFLCGQDDFEQFLWSVVFLAMGGIALGKGVTSSGLLDKMDILIRGLISGQSEFGVVMVLTTVVLVSHVRTHAPIPPSADMVVCRLSRRSSVIR